MKIENIDTTLEEIQEVGEQMRVINEAISQPVGGFQDLEMDDLEAELAELEAEELDNQVRPVYVSVSMLYLHYAKLLRIPMIFGEGVSA